MEDENKQISEFHLIVIWEHGRYAENEIEKRIKENLTVIQTFLITWSPYLVNRNYSRFYGANLPENSQKEVYAGRGEFKLFVVQDEFPKYRIRSTSKGDEKVNINLFDLKTNLRKLTGGGHKIHATNNTEEFRHDIVMLLGLSQKDFVKKYFNQPRNEIKMHRDVTGALGWKSLRELFYVLEECTESVVLRNSKNMNLEYLRTSNGDVDLLVRDKKLVQYILGDLSVINSRFKEDSKVSIDNSIVLFELYEANDGVYGRQLENFLLDKKQLNKGIPVLPSKLEYIMLIFHGILHHKKLSNKHLIRLKEYTEYSEQSYTIKDYLLDLVEYLNKEGLVLVTPHTRSQYFNTELLMHEGVRFKKRRMSVIKHYLGKLVLLESINNHTELIVGSFLNNYFDLCVTIRILFIRRSLNIYIGSRPRYLG